MGRGKLRIHLGAAPGVGKTYAMLAEAHRRAERGTDCVVGFVETHGRPRTEALLTGLERVPYRKLERGGVTVAEMDLDAVLARRPRVALVDELAHTNAPGSRNAKRWQDVEELLAAGIDVLSTVGIQHLESLGDTVESITGVRERETVPDEVVRRAAQVELVDMTPEALRRRMAHGNIHQPDQVDAALSSYFRPGNLAALRELALLWVADRVDAHLQRYRSEHAVSAIWGSRERIVVGLTGGPEGRTLIRRAARLAEKGAGGQLLAVYISRSDGLTSASPGELAAQRTLVEDLGGSFHHVVGDDIPAALLDFARGANATQIVLGSSRRRAWQYVLGPGVGATVARDCGPDLDVHIVTHEEAAKGRGLPVARGAPLGRLRLAWGWVAGTAGPVLLAVLLNAFDPGLAIDMLMFLAVTVARRSSAGWRRPSPRRRSAPCCSTSSSPRPCTPGPSPTRGTSSPSSCSSRSARRWRPWSTSPPGAPSRRPGCAPSRRYCRSSRATCCAARPAWRTCWSGSGRPSAWSPPRCWNGPGTSSRGPARAGWAGAARSIGPRTPTSRCPSGTTWRWR